MIIPVPGIRRGRLGAKNFLYYARIYSAIAYSNIIALIILPLLILSEYNKLKIRNIEINARKIIRNARFTNARTNLARAANRFENGIKFIPSHLH